MSASLCLRQCHPQVIASIVSDYVAGARDGLAMARRYDALSALPASRLARLGLTRADISRVVATDAPAASASRMGAWKPRRTEGSG